MKKIIQILNQPHPGYPGAISYFKTVAGISFSVFLILSLLQPFNIASRNIGGDPYLSALVYSFGAAITMSANFTWLLIFPRWFEPVKWTLGKELLVLIFQIVTIAVTIWAINIFRGNLPSTDKTYMRSLLLVINVGALPYIIATFVKHNYLLRRNLHEAQEINRNLQVNASEIRNKEFVDEALIIPRLTGKISLGEFLYAESKGNNLIICFIRQGLIAQNTMRCTLNEFMKLNNHLPKVFRSHRSFAINLDKVLSINGNASGYQVSLHPQAPAIVVSRSVVPAFKERVGH